LSKSVLKVIKANHRRDHSWLAMSRTDRNMWHVVGQSAEREIKRFRPDGLPPRKRRRAGRTDGLKYRCVKIQWSSLRNPP
jgi:hypothetical protein